MYGRLHLYGNVSVQLGSLRIYKYFSMLVEFRSIEEVPEGGCRRDAPPEN